MPSTVATIVSARPSPSSKPNLAEPVDLDDSMSCPLTLDDCSILASAGADMSPFRSARQRQGRINEAQGSTEPNIHSPPLSGIWRERRPSMFSTPPTRLTMLPPPPPSLPLRPAPPHQHRYPANMSDSFSGFGRQSNSVMAGEDAVPLSRVAPDPVWPSANQLKVAYTYGIRREDGTYTRLIRADELDSYDFERVPVSQGPEGMIILPPLQQTRPEQRDGSELMVSYDVIQTLPTVGADRSQHVDDTQMQIDSIVAKASISPVVPPKSLRREKIYCDKWIHEGVCAFTQLGCKYKHEMPMDKATQLSLGLNHGIPTWYKRAQAVQIRPDAQLPDTSSPLRTTGPWRRMATTAPSPTVRSIRGGIQSPPAGITPFGTSSFGPIAPPMPIAGQHASQLSNNPFALLSSDIKADDDEEDKSFIWHGRGR